MFDNILGDAGTLALIASAIVIAIQVLKKLYYKLPWGWVQKTPGELWLVLSIGAGIAVALVFNFNIIADAGLSLPQKFETIISGLTVGAGSKLIHSVATTAGAKLNAIKTTNNQISEVPAVSETLTVSTTPVIPDNTEVSSADIYERVSVSSDKYYVMIDGVLYPIKKE